jgi:hypothetical protein
MPRDLKGTKSVWEYLASEYADDFDSRRSQFQRARMGGKDDGCSREKCMIREADKTPESG